MNIDVKQVLNANPAMWVEQAKVRLASGDTYSFKDRPYLIKPMSSLARRKCVIKATQLGFSETFILDSLHGCFSGRYPQGASYIFPNDTEMRTFVQSRFNPLIKDNKETIGKFVTDTDTTYYKRVSGANLYFDGGRLSQVIEGQQKESAATRGKSFDHCVLDEYDLMDESLLQKAEGRMGASMVKSMTVISNPTVENHKIDRLFQLSNQMLWFRRCGCGEWTCPDEEFPNFITRKGCHCRKCGKVLGYQGEWVARFPERNKFTGIQSEDWEGYQISQLNIFTNSPWVILQEFQNPPNGNIEDFWKLRMGRAYTPKENRLTEVEVYNCCANYPQTDTCTDQTVMGVDVGKDRYHYIIGVRTDREKFDILKFGCAESFEDIGMIAIRMNVYKAVVDIRPYEAAARKFQKDMKFPVYLCEYSFNPLQDVVWDTEKKIVKVFRTGIFDISHRIVVEKRVRLPFRNSQTRDFARQYCEPYKVKRQDLRTGSINYIYDKGNGEDHYRNAMNYFLIAGRSAKIHSPYRTKPRRNKCIYERVRL